MTPRIIGWSISFFWKAARPRTWLTASASARRMMPSVAPTVPRRVWCTMSMMTLMPRPSSPRRKAWVSWYSISAEAFDLLPSLSLIRMTWSVLRLPSGRMRGTRKQEMPPSA